MERVTARGPACDALAVFRAASACWDGAPWLAVGCHGLSPTHVAALLAAWVHRLSGWRSRCSAVHFSRGLAISGEARLESFLRWSDQPLVKISEAVLLGLLAVHLLGGLRLLALENLPWRGGQARLALLAGAAAMAVVFVFLASVF